MLSRDLVHRQHEVVQALAEAGLQGRSRTSRRASRSVSIVTVICSASAGASGSGSKNRAATLSIPQ